MTDGGANQIEPKTMSHLSMPSPNAAVAPLGEARRGYHGRVHAIKAHPRYRDLPHDELERRLIELGFTEGARVEILHEGLIGRDPIAVRVDGATIAIRRREAMAIAVEEHPAP